MKPDWLKFKKYPHIGKPLTFPKDVQWVTAYVTDPTRVANHKFVPLIHRTITQRRYRPGPNAQKTESGKRQRIASKKNREIYYPSHLDSIIYSYYGFLLTSRYEDYLEGKPFGDVVVAYRKIPMGKGKSGNKSNIEFAFEAFEFIEKNKGLSLIHI
jgi:hypothetical protein